MEKTELKQILEELRLFDRNRKTIQSIKVERIGQENIWVSVQHEIDYWLNMAELTTAREYQKDEPQYPRIRILKVMYDEQFKRKNI
jgi:hypothetical protein